ncbi:MAG: hypothetical protein ACTHKU_04330 [Verrucomicrobiota bacterium]
MSLGRLLSSGKSLVGLHDPESRYQMRPQNLLPKFGSDKNPFTTAKPQSLKPESAGKFAVTARSMSSAEVAAAKLKETKRLPAVKAIKQPVPTGPSLKTVALSRLAGIAGWAKKLNPLSWLARRKTAAAKTTAPGFEKAPVQAELSLDKIKVMRNDLSDADVEVVPAKISVKPKTEPVVQPAQAKAETAELIKT